MEIKELSCKNSWRTKELKSDVKEFSCEIFFHLKMKSKEFSCKDSWRTKELKSDVKEFSYKIFFQLFGEKMGSQGI